MGFYSFLIKTRDYFRELHIRRVRRNLKVPSGKFNRDKWRLVENLVGVEPVKPIFCLNCNSKMLLRKANASRSQELNFQNSVFDLFYKCPHCSMLMQFGIAVPEVHYQKVKTLRKKKGIVGVTYVPLDLWNKQTEVRERLEALGYW